MNLTEKMVKRALGDYTVKEPIIRKLVIELNRFMAVETELARIHRQRQIINQTADHQHGELNLLEANLKQNCPHYGQNTLRYCLACKARV